MNSAWNSLKELFFSTLYVLLNNAVSLAQIQRWLDEFALKRLTDADELIRDADMEYESDYGVREAGDDLRRQASQIGMEVETFNMWRNRPASDDMDENIRNLLSVSETKNLHEAVSLILAEYHELRRGAAVLALRLRDARTDEERDSVLKALERMSYAHPETPENTLDPIPFGYSTARTLYAMNIDGRKILRNTRVDVFRSIPSYKNKNILAYVCRAKFDDKSYWFVGYDDINIRRVETDNDEVAPYSA